MKFNFRKLIISITILYTLTTVRCDRPTESKIETPPQKLRIYINEFWASNKSIYADEAGQYDD